MHDSREGDLAGSMYRAFLERKERRTSGATRGAHGADEPAGSCAVDWMTGFWVG